MQPDSKTIAWLLENDNPPVRYLTLTNLLKKSSSTKVVQEAKSQIMKYEVTQEILQHFHEFIKDDDKASWKYQGKYWQLIFLGQFLADRSDPRVAELAENILQSRKWISSTGMQCVTAKILQALVRLGYSDNPFVVEETATLAKRILDDQGIKCTLMDYSLLPRCQMALPKLLLCFGQIPEEKRDSVVGKAIDRVVKSLLQNKISKYVPGNRKKWQEVLATAPKRSELPKGQTVKDWVFDQKEMFLQSYGIGDREAKPGWVKFGFPSHYNSDILEAMYALALVGMPMNPQLEEPLEVIENKMREGFIWNLDNSLNGKMLMDVEQKGKPSKWITYFALYVLNHFGRLTIG
ncbi:MAG: hypothetical protein MI921_14330 [Cytophagales bacterium]|nr:hypothetical protein [Cytophagales bacterium]